MTDRTTKPFEAVMSTAPSFQVSITSASTTNALESTSVREWDGAGGRSIRVSSLTGSGDFHFVLGDSAVTCSSNTTIQMLGGTVEVWSQIKPSHTHIAMYSSTDVTANVTLGYGQ